MAGHCLAPPDTTGIRNHEDLANEIANTPTNTPTTINIAQSFNFTGETITIPSGVDITLTSNTQVTLTNTTPGQRHFIVYGSLTICPNIVLCNGENPAFCLVGF